MPRGWARLVFNGDILEVRANPHVPLASGIKLVAGAGTLIDDYWGFRCVDPRVSFPFIGIHNVVHGVCIQSKSRKLKLL